ncbi:MAG: aminotransferase class V-fold PLP-dependent enzyme [Bacteroidales bacterium]
MMNKKELFCLDKEVIFLNHGSFGACPVSILEKYQDWQKILESQPVEFLGRKHAALLKTSRQALGKYIQSDADNLVYVSNATTAINFIGWSVKLKPGDEVITTNLEYGAMDRMWQFICHERGANYKKVKVDLPFDKVNFIKSFTNEITSKTKVIFLSMITSATALRIPVEEVCKIARDYGILTVVDGAHAPGQIPLNLNNMNVDFFTGNCHKWMMAPKGTAFLYASPAVQPVLKPLIISWGKEIDTINNSDFLNDFEYLGTRDISGFLTVPECISFLEQYNPFNHRQDLYHLLETAAEGMRLILETPPITEIRNNGLMMYAHPLPVNLDGKKLKYELYEQFKIEIPVVVQNQNQYIRVSVQIYNTLAEIVFFLEKLKFLVNKLKS